MILNMKNCLLKKRFIDGFKFLYRNQEFEIHLLLLIPKKDNYLR